MNKCSYRYRVTIYDPYNRIRFAKVTASNMDEAKRKAFIELEIIHWERVEIERIK